MAKATPRSKCLKAAQLHARISHADDTGYCTCVSCGIKKLYKEMDGGHYIPKGASEFWSLEPENIWPQCKGCNGFGMKYHNKEAVYTIYMQEMYGWKFVQLMLDTQADITRLSRGLLEDKIKEFNEQIAFHKNRIGA